MTINTVENGQEGTQVNRTVAIHSNNIPFRR